MKAFTNFLPWLVLLAAVLVAPLVLIIRRVRAKPGRLAASSQATTE
jgi:hypothetical protein